MKNSKAVKPDSFPRPTISIPKIKGWRRLKPDERMSRDKGDWIWLEGGERWEAVLGCDNLMVDDEIALRPILRVRPVSAKRK